MALKKSSKFPDFVIYSYFNNSAFTSSYEGYKVLR